MNARADDPLPKVLAPPPKLVRHASISPRDPAPPAMLGTRLDVYDITVPFGSISRSSAFWRWINEDPIDPGVDDALRRNGVRMGLALATDWPSLRAVFDTMPASTKLSSTTGQSVSNMELSFGSPILSENIFSFNRNNVMSGRTFEQCQNLLEISFAQVPRQQGSVRVTIDPLIRSTRKQLAYSAMGNEEEITYTYPERLLDVNLSANVPLENILVIAPSSESALPGSIGHAFFVNELPQLMQEHVLIIVPKMFRTDDAVAAKP